METAETFLTFLGSLVNAALGWVGYLVDYIKTEPLILVPMLVFFIFGGVIAVVNRLIRG